MPRPARQVLSALLFSVVAAFPAFGQSPADSKAVEAIVGSDVQQEEATTSAKEEKVLAAIDKTAENTGTVRKTSKVDHVDIVFLTDAARSEGGPSRKIESKIRQHESEIVGLRQEIEANALLFHAIDSRRVLTRDVLAVEFESDGKVVIYAAAKPSE